MQAASSPSLSSLSSHSCPSSTGGAARCPSSLHQLPLHLLPQLHRQLSPPHGRRMGPPFAGVVHASPRQIQDARQLHLFSQRNHRRDQRRRSRRRRRSGSFRTSPNLGIHVLWVRLLGPLRHPAAGPQRTRHPSRIVVALCRRFRLPRHPSIRASFDFSHHFGEERVRLRHQDRRRSYRRRSPWASALSPGLARPVFFERRLSFLFPHGFARSASSSPLHSPSTPADFISTL